MDFKSTPRAAGCRAPTSGSTVGARPMSLIAPETHLQPGEALPWRAVSQVRPGPEVMGSPALEHEQRPEDFPVVSNPAHVFDHQPSNRLRIEYAPGAHPFGREHLGKRAREGTTEPGTEGYAKALFPPGEDLRREAVRHCVLEHALEPEEPLSPEWRRDAADELDEGVVEQRGPQFNAGRHAGPIRVGEVLPG